MTKTHTPAKLTLNDEAVLRLIEERDNLLAAVRCALERIEDGSMEQTNEHGQPTRHARQVSADTIAFLRAAIQKAEGKE